MKHLLFYFNPAVVLTLLLFALFGCSKSPSVTPPPVVKQETLNDYLVKAPWKITDVTYSNLLGEWIYDSGTIPDTLKNLVLTFKSDNTYSESGAKTESGSYVINAADGSDNIGIIKFTPTSGTVHSRFIFAIGDFGLTTYIRYEGDLIKTTNAYGEMERFEH